MQSPRTRNFPDSKVDVVPVVLDVDQPREEIVPLNHLSQPQGDHHRPVILRRAQPIDTRDARHNEDVAATHQGTRGGEPQLLDLLVDAGVLLDVDVGLRNVRFGLVVIVIADKILDCVAREELLELAEQLGGQRLVMRDDQVGRWNCWMTLAIVNVLPLPVTPISTWDFSSAQVLGKGLDGLRAGLPPVERGRRSGTRANP